MLVKFRNLNAFARNVRLEFSHAYTTMRRVTTKNSESGNSSSLSVGKIRSFEEIPGPKSWPVVGTLLNYVPIIGSYTFDRLHWNGMLRLRQFGPLVREEFVPGVTILWVFTPEDIKNVLRVEGRYPERKSHFAMENYRLSRLDIYNTGGILPTNGQKWRELRSAFQRPLNVIENISVYIEDTNTVLDRFMEVLEERKELSTDITPYLSHLFIELIGLFAFDNAIDGLSESGLQCDSMASKLIRSAQTVNTCTPKLDSGLQLWRLFDTPLYKELKQAHQIMENFAVDIVHKKKYHLDYHGIPEDRPLSLLETFFNNRRVDVKDVVGMTVDMILSGMDTTSSATSFLLYHLAINPRCQEELYKECCHLLPEKNSPITDKVLQNAYYTKAALKESLRLFPVCVGVQRIIAYDVVLSGYRVPEGTNVVTQNQVTCRLEEYFPEANKFIPERWIKGRKEFRKSHPFLHLPFGFGPRSCIARRFAEQNIHMLILKLIRNYEVTWCGGTLDCIGSPNTPDRPVLLIFKEREDVKKVEKKNGKQDEKEIETDEKKDEKQEEKKDGEDDKKEEKKEENRDTSQISL